jgi:hypothetical protein
MILLRVSILYAPKRFMEFIKETIGENRNYCMENKEILIDCGSIDCGGRGGGCPSIENFFNNKKDRKYSLQNVNQFQNFFIIHHSKFSFYVGGAGNFNFYRTFNLFRNFEFSRTFQNCISTCREIAIYSKWRKSFSLSLCKALVSEQVFYLLIKLFFLG